RLLQEFYCSMCFKQVELFVKSCNICQRIGKPNEQIKAPIAKVPIISEPFRRVVVDVIGPLPLTERGSRYIVTLLCSGTRFPEAIPLKQSSSVDIIDSLLQIFFRVGFP